MKIYQKKLIGVFVGMMLVGLYNDVLAMCRASQKRTYQCNKRRRLDSSLRSSISKLYPDMQQCISSMLDDESLANLSQVNREWYANTREQLMKRHAKHIAQDIAAYAYGVFVAAMRETSVGQLEKLFSLLPDLRYAMYDTSLWLNEHSLRNRDFKKTLRNRPEFYIEIAKIYDSFYQVHRDVRGIKEAINSIHTLIPQCFQRVVREKCAPIIFSSSRGMMAAESGSTFRVTERCCDMLLCAGADEVMHKELREKFERIHRLHWALDELVERDGQLDDPVIIAAIETFKLIHCMDTDQDFKQAFNDLYNVCEHHLEPILEYGISGAERVRRINSSYDAFSKLLDFRDLPSFLIQE